MQKHKGIIQDTGMVKGEDGKLYTPDMLFGETILLACTSWSRIPIIAVKGEEVEFVISPTGKAYNFKLTNKNLKDETVEVAKGKTRKH